MGFSLSRCGYYNRCSNAQQIKDRDNDHIKNES